jgi:hypothetical protein
MQLHPEVTINGRTFRLVKKRREAPMAVYRSDNRFLRIGDKENLQAELKMRDSLKEYGFPIPNRFKESKTEDGLYYYIEKSMGYKHFSQIFKDDIENKGDVSSRSFSEFLRVVKEFAVAQLNTKTSKHDYNEFTNAIDIKVLMKELSSYKKKIWNFYEEAKERFSIFPSVLTHGDFNSHNLYKRGVIDFENIFYGPAGYDLVSAVITPDYFPIRGDYEVVSPFRFSDEHKEKYFKVIDELYLENGLPRLSDYTKYFEFCRATWMTAKMGHMPKLHKFRTDLYIKNFLT